MSIAIDGMEEIIKEFLVESGEALDLLDRDLITLERDPSSRELLAEIFRAVHTIKGTSGVLGFPKVEQVAHIGENVLSRLRDGKLKLHPKLTSGLLAMVDALRQLLSEIDRTGAEGNGDYTPVVRQLEGLVDAPAVTVAAPQAAVVKEIEVVSPSEPGPSTAPAPAAAATPAPPITVTEKATKTMSPPEPKPGAGASAAESRGEGVKDPQGISASNIRVDVSLLDKMMNLVGELVLARNQILQFTAAQTDATLLSAAQRLNLITTELQEGVMKTRMQPIGNVWNKFPRVVRDLALQFGKQVEIAMEGSETELDKTIIEAIKDPLTHILRNAIDHGIELPQRRLEAGKSASGQLNMRAFHEGGQVNIEISDDGAGIHLEKVRQRALERGLITAEQGARMGDRELVNLVFLPGFSTAEKVTNVSGRGVGMDVVKTNIEKIGGVVDLQSVAGHGTILKIKIPLTLAIIPALIVTSGGERFAIPQVSLLELVRLEGGEAGGRIEHIHGAPVYRLRGRLLPLAFLNRELGLSGSGKPAETELSDSAGNGGSSGPLNIVVLQADERQFGLVVDLINDTEEIVVKPLGKQLKGIACFAGATIMGDGQVALILDVLGVAQKASVVTELHEQAGSEAAAGASSEAVRQRWLLFRGANGQRMAVALSSVARLEEFPAERIERAGDGEVVQYRGEIMPLVRIAQLLDGPVAPRQDLLQVVVFAHAGHSVGLVVDHIEDITDEAVEVHEERRSRWLSGSAVIQQKVTDLVDLEQVVALAADGATATAAAGRA